jgi:hypothetical protein
MRRLSAFTEDVKAEEILELYVYHYFKFMPTKLKKSQQTYWNHEIFTGLPHKKRVFYKKVEIFKKNRNFSDPLASIYIQGLESKSFSQYGDLKQITL